MPIYYEARVAKIELSEDITDDLDEKFDEVTEELEEDETNAVARRWSQVEALVGADNRLDTVQRFPIKFKLSGPAANLGARHGPAGIVRFGGTAVLFRRLPGR